MSWHTKSSYPSGNEGPSTGKGCHVHQRNCFRPTSEPIHNGEEVGEALKLLKRAN